MAFRSALCPNVRLLHNVITEAEEAIVDKFLTSLFSRKRYQGSHWDDVIVQYKELELSNYKVPADVTEVLKKAQQRVQSVVASPFEFLPAHVIELSENGYIGPHVDSVKFSGGFVAGLSLFSTRVMALSYNSGEAAGMKSMKPATTKPAVTSPVQCTGIVQGVVGRYSVDENGLTYTYTEGKSINQNQGQDGASYVNHLLRQSGVPDQVEATLPGLIEVVLPPRSLYVLMGPWRYNYNHAILGTGHAPRTISPLSEAPAKRTSIIFRDAKA